MADFAKKASRGLLEALAEHLFDGRRVACLVCDREGVVLEGQGELGWYAIEGAVQGRPAAELCPALLGLVPLSSEGSPAGVAGETQRLPRLELVEGRATDVTVEPTADGYLCLFADATPEAEREERFQQRGNELALLLRFLGAAVYRCVAPGRFTLIGEGPRWLARFPEAARSGEVVLGDVFAFLESFMQEAEEVWRRNASPLSSGVWSEELPDGDQDLEAIAVAIPGTKIGVGGLLVLQTASRHVAERQQLLQRAREAGLHHERLRREIDQKEVLLHCIVHDLKGPLSGMVGSMSLIQARELSPPRIAELLALGLEQARAQESMIRTILDVFSTEIADIESFESEARHAPELLSHLRAVLTRYRAAYEHSEVALELRLGEGLPRQAHVVGRSDRLERVFDNLLENALRYAPPDSSVVVSVEADPTAYLVWVEDQGPGVAQELQKRLFHAPLGGRSPSGVAGLGLYFCHHVLGIWGGHIAYEDRAGGGSRFRVRLPKALT